MDFSVVPARKSAVEFAVTRCGLASHHTGDGARDRNMSDTYIIEVSSEAAGIVVREKSGFRFFAAVHKFNPLDGRVFKNAREAERAATRFLAGRLDPLPA